MFARRDRIELSLLALLVLAWAFVVAPLIHQFDHGHQHSHGGDSSAPHGAGSLEHHHLALSSPHPTPDLRLVLLACATVELIAPRAPQLMPRRSDSSPQGP